MGNRSGIRYLVSFAFILLFAGLLLAQNAPDRPLIVNGKSVGNAVQMGTHAYVDVETIAQATNGTVTLEPDRIVLTIPAQGSNAAPSPAPSAGLATVGPAPPPGLTRNFASQGIALLAEMREWRGAVGTILTYGVPVVGTWPQDYHDRVEADLERAALDASTAADQDAMQLLRNEFSNLEQWANNVVGAREALNATNSVRPDAMQSDTSLTKISNCSRFLSSMLVTGTFADDQSCH